MKAVTALGNGAATARGPSAPARWGFPEFFVISQTAIPALLYLPGSQQFRLYIRIASFAISFATLVWWAVAVARSSRPHSARRGSSRAGIHRRHVLPPTTSSILVGIAQLVLYFSVMAPLFWVGTFVRTPEHLARLMALLLICNGVNALVGVLQVYDPGRWMPPEMSRIISESVYGLGTVTYRGPDGRMIVRPPGLFDTPGAVAGPGMYAALLGLVFASSAIAWWKRLAALGASFAGIAAIYLSQVRVSLIVAVLMFAAYFSVLMLQERKSRAMVFGGVAAAIIVGTFSLRAHAWRREHRRAHVHALRPGPRGAVSPVSRGGQLSYTFGELLQTYPMGAGLGRWGMIAAYFGSGATPGVEPLWAEIQVAGWAIDGGIALLILSIGALVVSSPRRFRSPGQIGTPNPRVRRRVLAANLGTGRAHLQLHAVRDADRDAVLVSRGRPAWLVAARAPERE